VRAATPTAAASLVVPERAALCVAIGALYRRLARAHAHHAGNCAQRLDAASRRLVHPAARLALQRERARALGRRLERAFRHDRAAAAQRVLALRARLLRELRTPLAQAARVERTAQALAQSTRERLAGDARKAERLGAALALLNPEAVLERGYAIVTAHGGRVIGDAGELRVGDDVALTLARGRAHASVTATDAGRDR